MKEKSVLKIVEDYVKNMSASDASHDWWHTYRVYNLALKMNKYEKANEFVVSMISLLHDVYDWKKGNEVNEDEAIRDLLKELKVINEIDGLDLDNICLSVAGLGFKGGFKKTELSLEGQIVQDADRLDAMGAMGIARTFTFGGKHGRTIYNPEQGIIEVLSEEQYKDIRSRDSINHFYEKLLKLKDLINTESGKKVAIKRHEFMEEYLKHFYEEWEVKDFD